MSEHKPLTLFYSYSHKDEDLRDELDDHLKLLEREGFILPWHDRKITGGNEWKGQIDENLTNADIILLLVSSSFIASDYCYDIEMETALQMHETGKAVVVPIILRDCRWPKAKFGKLQALPTDGRPVTGEEWHTRDKAFTVVAQELEKVISKFSQNKDSRESNQPVEVEPKLNIRLKQIPVAKPYFSGREEDLKDMRKLFKTKPFIFIEGGGGIGKTQFIAKLISELGIDDRTVWYECHPTSQPDDLIRGAGFEEILLGESKNEKAKFSAFKDKIEEFDLVVFLDNYQEVQANPNFKSFLSFINDYLSKGHIIVIGRDNITSPSLQPARVHLTGLGNSSIIHARKLLKHSFPEKDNIEDAILQNICDKLLGYPLAIDLAMYLLSQNVPSDKILEVAVDEAKEGDGAEKISERLLNEIFIRPDATLEEKNFLKSFSVYRGKVNVEAVKNVVDIAAFEMVARKLVNKNILTVDGDYYELHPLLREFCYEKLEDKESKHARAASYYLQLRGQEFDPELEEKIYYHLSCANLWSDVVKVIERYGREFISQGYLDRLKQMIIDVRATGLRQALFLIFEGDIEQIKGNWEDALEIFSSINDDDQEIQTEATIKYGEMLFRTGMYKDAKRAYEKVIDSNVDDRWVARAYNNIGLIYHKVNDQRLANSFLSKALVIREHLGNKRDIAITIHNIAILKAEKGDFEPALKMEEKALRICDEINDQENKAIYLGNVARVQVAQSNFKGAFASINEAMRTSKRIGYKEGIANSWCHLGSYYRGIKKKEKALECYQQNLAVSLEIGDPSGLSSSYRNIGITLCEEFKNYNEGVLFLLKAIALNNKFNMFYDNVPQQQLNQFKQQVGIAKYKEVVHDSFNALEELQDFVDLNIILGEPRKVEALPGRNEPCHCGSGIKYKKCHGK